jgi:methionine-rich copper-binding protein CopC
MTLARTLLVTILAALGVLAATSPAWAHTTLTSSSPAQGATLATAPAQIKLTFAEPVTLPAAPISITGPDGMKWSVGTPSVAGPVVSAPVTPRGPAGRYTLAYKVTADDGDAITGTVAFTLAAPAAG